MANILVIGSSGTVGTELVRLLRAQGHTVSEATSRAPTRAGQVQLDIVTAQAPPRPLAASSAPFCCRRPATPTRTNCSSR